MVQKPLTWEDDCQQTTNTLLGMLSTMFKMANVTAILFINVHVGYKGETWQ